MGSHSPSRLRFIDRLFANHPRQSAKFDILRNPAVRALNEIDLGRSSSDAAWLKRSELRGSDDVIHVLERSGFPDENGAVVALFVDGRCGLIKELSLGRFADLDVRQGVAEVLRVATRCKAEAVILATHCPGRQTAAEQKLKEFTMGLFRKGDAIGLTLLDHFILTSAGWKRLFSFKQREKF